MNQTINAGIGLNELLKALEPLIRQVVREELAEVVSRSPEYFYLEANSPLYQDMQDILQRKKENKLNFISHEEVWRE
ncbi:MAG: hypothetical protein GY862_35550 [Gammaproteobacteria bacterium]|nr:hypothetical protein [Gammaproteobacteria bacterium]